MNFLHLTTFVLLTFVAVIYAKEQQCMLVRGFVRCNKTSTQLPVFARFVDYDGPIADDDLMDENYASKNSGAFQLYGCATDTVGDIDPELHFYHKCRGEEKRVKFELPQEFIGREYNYTSTIYLDKDFTADEKKKFGYKDEDKKAYPVPKCDKN